MAKTRVIPIEGWVLYDGACGFCSRWVPFWRKTLKRRGFDIAPLQSKWVAEKLRLSQDELTADVRLLLADGQLLCGPEVYRYVMRRIWWTMPFYALSVLPILREFFDAGYRAIAKNRHRLSGQCGLSGTKETNSIKTRQQR